MKYISTRGGIEPVSFQDAVMMGLADDGGLLIPAEIPLVKDRLHAWSSLSYPDLAFEIMHLFAGDDIPAVDLRRIVQHSYASFDHPDVTPVVQVGDLHVLELFHGPTLAFKDIALQFLGNIFEYILEKRKAHLNILGATSGDTGSAAIYGVRGKKNIEIFIMHPHNRVSPIQERQMTTVLDDNVHNIAIEGTFDDGQRIMKEIFGDLPLKRRYNLGAVNSVNWARVLAQVVYYFRAAFEVCQRTGSETVQCSVPTGNFGDIFAGYIAVKMGAPIKRLLLATNENDILSRFFNTGIYALGDVHLTLSPSMDIQVASNFERYLFYRLGCDPAQIRALMTEFAATGRIDIGGSDAHFAAERGTTQETLATICKYYEDYEYLLDPHTAVGVAVAEKFADPAVPAICLATAHPAKFPQAITDALGKDIARHSRLEGIMDMPCRCAILPAERQAIIGHLAEKLHQA